LSADNILPRGRYVEFNMEDYAGEVAEDSRRSNEMEEA
jgi:hypothetical protein